MKTTDNSASEKERMYRLLMDIYTSLSQRKAVKSNPPLNLYEESWYYGIKQLVEEINNNGR